MTSTSICLTVLSGEFAKHFGAISKIEGRRLDFALPVRLALGAAVSVEDFRQTYYGEIYEVVSLERGAFLHSIRVEHCISGMERIAHLMDVGSERVSRAA